jgi:GMP synthase-like glutamine amidotransferase
MSTRPLHIGILMANTDVSAFSERHPEDGEKFTALLKPLRPDWTFTTVMVRDGVFPADAGDFDGYIITGSPASANGSDPWIARLLAFIREIDKQRIPTVGCCFGHQAIATALGGSVEKSAKGWGLGAADTHYTAQEPWMLPSRQTLRLHAAHGEQVVKLPPRAVLLGGDGSCPIGAFKVGAHIMTTEFHPEMTPDFIAALVTELDGTLDGPTIARARAELARPAESAVFAEWMVRFLEHGRASVP